MPALWVALIPLTILILLLYFAISALGSDALSGASQVILLLTSAICVAIGMGIYRVEWERFEEAIIHNIKGGGVALIVLLIIGALSGAWMLSGIVPTLIYYGMYIIHPHYSEGR